MCLLFSYLSPRLEPFLLHFLFTLFCFSDVSKGGLALGQPRGNAELSYVLLQGSALRLCCRLNLS